jgi:tol-pal system protein YbgF
MNNKKLFYLKASVKKTCVLLIIFGVALMSEARTLVFQSSGTAESSNSTSPINATQGQSTSQIQTTSTQAQTSRTASSSVSAVPAQTTSYPVNTAASANSELFFMLEQLQQEVNTLRGIIEEQGHELRMLKESSRDRYVDIDSRVLDLTRRVSELPKNTGALSGSVNSPTTTPDLNMQAAPVKQNSAASTQVAAANKPLNASREPSKAENDAYNEAYSLIKDKKFDDAILALFSYTENYPESPLLPNVYYWLGEVYLATDKLEQAKTSFTLVMTAYPDNSKVPDALYKLAITLDRLGQKELAKQYLKDVKQKYPASSAAKLAQSYSLNP